MDKAKVTKYSGIIFFMLNILASALNYFCQLIMARVLSVKAYGTVNTIFSFMMVIAAPGTTLTMIVARYYARSGKKDKKLYLKKQWENVLKLTGFVLVFCIIFFKFFSRILAIQDCFVLAMAFFLGATGFFQPLFAGVFTGYKKFILVGIYSLFIPMYKLFATVCACVYPKESSYSLYTLLIIILLGVIATACWGHVRAIRIIGEDTNTKQNITKLYSKEDLDTLIMNIGLVFFMNLDLFSVRYYCSDTESGLYGAMLLFGRIVYYFSTTIGTILLPSVAGENIDENKKITMLNKAVLIMIGLAVILLLPIVFLRNIIIRVLYGSEYLAGEKYVIFVCLIAASTGLFTIMINYAAGVGKTRYTMVVMCIIDILLVIMCAVVKNIVCILLIIGLTGIVGAILIYLHLVKKRTICYGNSKCI